MSIAVETPQIDALRRLVEATAGIPLHTHADFEELSLKIGTVVKGGLSPITLERLWGYSTRNVTSISRHTLDVLSRYAGLEDWESFLLQQKTASKRESELFTDRALIASDLPVGARLSLSWRPDRIIRVRHLGESRFMVEESLHSSLSPGDTFSCIQFQTGMPLYLDRFHKADGSAEGRYAVGQDHGLTSCRILPDEAR